MKKLFFLVALLARTCVRAQSVQEVEQRVNSLYGRIVKYSSSFSTSDSIPKLNKQLLDYLMKVTAGNRELLNCELHVGDNGLGTVTSEDHKIKIYWWDTFEGGSMAAHNAVMQFATAKGLFAKVLNDVSVDGSDGHFDYGRFYNKIISIRRASGEIIYLVIDGGAFGGGMGTERVVAVSLKNGRPARAKLFKSKKSITSSVDYDYDYSASINQGKNINLEFKFSDDNSTLYVPYIKSNQEITDQYLIYKFDGNHYVYSHIGK